MLDAATYTPRLKTVYKDQIRAQLKEEFSYSNEVFRIHEDPRVTKPYTDNEWADALALGQKVDDILMQEAIRLTMGGEPTFVSIDNQTDPEWNTAADGPHKRALASDLAGRLKDAYAPTGLVQRSQGKWYPGEPLPRWQIALLWRTDGHPIWRRPELLADPWRNRAAAQASIEVETSGPARFVHGMENKRVRQGECVRLQAALGVVGDGRRSRALA